MDPTTKAKTNSQATTHTIQKDERTKQTRKATVA